MATNSNSSSGGLGCLSVLQIIFIVLKVLNLIDWSWWLVFIPAFVGFGIAIFWIIVILILYYISEM